MVHTSVFTRRDKSTCTAESVCLCVCVPSQFQLCCGALISRKCDVCVRERELAAVMLRLRATYSSVIHSNLDYSLSSSLALPLPSPSSSCCCSTFPYPSPSSSSPVHFSLLSFSPLRSPLALLLVKTFIGASHTLVVTALNLHLLQKVISTVLFFIFNDHFYTN